ncbi:galactosyltransferase-related protein [Kordia sp.]|uniref:galactosyltransferase-related protein n=1 Tax=Kordia sp. TaxID=1965332 RepID=UPI003D26CE88
MNVSIIIPWSNRPDLAQSLEKNHDTFNFDHIEIIIVNFGGNIAEINTIVTASALKNIKIIHIESEVFNKSKAINIGAYHAKNETLFILDCDIVLNDAINTITADLKDENSFLTLQKTTESNRSSKKIIEGEIKEIAYYIGFKNQKGKEVIVETNRMFLGENARSCPGLVILSKSNFIKIGGMNSDLVGWGWEDIDFVYRLEYHEIKRIKKGNCIHLSHSDNKRYLIQEDKATNEDLNFKKALANYLIGHFLGTYEEDTDAL